MGKEDSKPMVEKVKTYICEYLVLRQGFSLQKNNPTGKNNAIIFSNL